MTTPTSVPVRASLVAVAGWPFLLTGFVSRLPAAMIQLGYLMVLAADGRGLAMAGLNVAACGLGSAVGAPIVGRLVDRFGALMTLGGATLISLLAQLGFLTALLAHGPNPLLWTLSAFVGAANPQIGAVVRSHWSHLAAVRRDPALVSRALGYEGAVDEATFVVGPIVAGSLVSALGAVPSVLAVAAATLFGQAIFLGHLWQNRVEWRQARHARERAAEGRGGGVDPVRAALPMLAVLGVGTLFGGCQTALTNLHQMRGESAFTGLVYGTVGIGSAAASLMVGRLATRVSPQWRVLLGGCCMGAGGLVLLMLPSVAVSFGVALLLGVGAGLTLVSSFGWMEAIAPRHRIATMMTILTTCITVGVSGGAAVSGRLAADPSVAFWPVVAAGVLAALASVGMWAVRPRD